MQIMTESSWLQRKLIDSRIKMEKELLEIPGKISHQRDKINGCEKEAEYYAKWKALNLPLSDNNEKKKEAESRRELREVMRWMFMIDCMKL